MSSFREKLRLASPLSVVLLSGRQTAEMRAVDNSSESGTAAEETPHLALVNTGTFRAAARRSSPISRRSN